MIDEEKNEEQDAATEVELRNLNYNEKQARDFYDRLRERIHATARKFAGKDITECLLLLPDFVMLLMRLMKDRRVEVKTKAMTAAVLVYLMSPVDIIPDFIPLLGYVDDLLITVWGLNRLLNMVEPKILEEHWSGEGNMLEAIQKAARIAEFYLGSKVVGQIRDWFKKLG